MAETRLRIVDAAVALHETEGPLRTTISAIAEQAGVERLTVYRHFPDEPSLFGACTERYFALHPPPDLSRWRRIEDPKERLEVGLRVLYTYWRETELMTTTILRDAEVAPERVGAGLVRFHDAIRAVLASGWGVRGHRRRLLKAAIGHSSSFRTWQSLARGQGLGDSEAADLMIDFVRRASGENCPPDHSVT